MRKIPTLFLRDPNTHLVTPEFNPVCEWVLECKGYPTRKYDGVACMIHDGHLYKRHLAKKSATTPAAFIPAQKKRDSVTGELPGWVPVEDGPEDEAYREAFQRLKASCKPWQPERKTLTSVVPKVVAYDDALEGIISREGFERRVAKYSFQDPLTFLEGHTYELIGPNIRGNPEHYREHFLIPHGVSELVKSEVPTTYDGLKEYFATHDIEGIVWWSSRSNENCRKCKIKASDFGVIRGERKKPKRR